MVETEIVNRALSLIGKDDIADINDRDNPTAVYAKAHFYSELNAVLRDHFWNCAITRAQITAQPAAPAFGYSYAYLLPPNCQKFKLDESHGTAEWVREGRYILTSIAAPLKLIYTRTIQNAAEIDADLSSAFEYRLASRFAAGLLHDSNKSDRMMQQYMVWVDQAKMNDGQEGSTRTWRGSGRYTAVRTYGG